MLIRFILNCAVVLIAGVPLGQCGSESVPFPGGDPPGLEPRVFAEGIVSTEGVDFAPVFSRDMKELYFTSMNPPQPAQVFIMIFDGRQWSAPTEAPFCGGFDTGTPALSPDGRTLYFSSNRPLEQSLQSFEPSNIWMVQKTSSGWSDPQELGPPINSSSYERCPSLARDGTMYFQSNVPGGKGKIDIYMASSENGRFAMPVNLGGAVNTEGVEADPCIAPDQSYLVFYSYGRDDGHGEGDLYVSFRDADDNWTKAMNLGPTINTEAEENFPALSPDGKYLFFSSTREGRRFPDVFWVDAAVIEAARP